MLAAGPGYERRLDMMLRLGPYGDAFGARPDGLTLRAAQGRIRTASTSARCGRGCPRCCGHRRARSSSRPQPLVADVGAAARVAGRAAPTGSSSSAAGTCAPTTAGCTTCPRWPAARTGAPCRSTPTTPPNSASTDTAIDQGRRRRGGGARRAAPTRMRRGVVSLPHGWGHDRRGTRLAVAAGQPGVNVNQLNDGTQLDPLSGTAVLNGIPVHIAPAAWVRSAPRSPSPRRRRSAGPARAARPPWPLAASASAGVEAVWSRPTRRSKSPCPESVPDSWAYCSARSLASSKARVRASFTSCESSSME